jgi:lipopolysaccharide transport system ATP-binding protein
MSFAIRVENLSKSYRLGATHAGSVRELVNNGWNRLLGRSRNFEPAILPAHESPDRLEGDSFWALRDVSFEVKPGEVVGIIGRNGSGKSTLLKILSQITAPTRGRVELHGRVASLLEVGTGFHPELSGRENIFLNGAILGMTKPEIRRKFDDIVAFAEIDKFIDTPVKRYSSGMYVRLAFAVAAHLEPEILIVDEVLAVGDAAFQKKCLGKMADIAGLGRTILFVSHNIGAVRSLCTNAFYLKAGAVEMSGPVRPVADHYVRADLDSDTASVFDLSTFKRNTVPTRLKLERLSITSDVPVRYGSPLELNLDYQCLDEITSGSLGVGFASIDGVRLLTIESDCGGHRRAISRGQGSVKFSIPRFPLTPGLYLLDIGARDGDGESLDYLPPRVEIPVIPSIETAGHVFHGVQDVRLEADWTWRV